MEYKIDGKTEITSFKYELPIGIISVRIYKPESADKKFPGIIFLPGFPGYQRNFDLAIELSLNGFATCTFDYPGVWKSSGKFHPLVGVRAVKEIKNFFIDRLSGRITNYGIFGHSWGATLALIYASEDPSCKSIAALATVNDLLSITSGKREDVAKMFINSAKPLNIKINSKQLEIDLDIVASKNILGNFINRINQPVLLIHGSDDQVVPLDQSKDIIKLYNDKFKLEILPGKDHNPKNREELLSILSNWYTKTLLGKKV